MSMIRDLRSASADPTCIAAAHEASRLYAKLYPEPRIKRAGMDSFSALLLRCYYGRTAESAACREYLYRWSLALRSPIFGAPHLLGQ